MRKYKILSDLSIVSNLPSDHSAVMCSIIFSKPKPSKIYLKRRKLKNIDIDAFKDDILNSSLHSQMSDAALVDVDSLSDQYNNVLQKLIDNHAPEITQLITLRPSAQWFNESIKALKRKRRQSERKYLSTGLEVHRQIYKDMCNAYTTEINSAKANHYRSLIANSDQKKLFHIIDGLFKVKPVPVLPRHASDLSLAN